jgi:hypothetical protein
MSSVSRSLSSSGRSPGPTMPTKKRSTVRRPSGGSAAKAASMRLVCVADSVQEALPTVGLAGLLLDIAVVDQLAEDAREALFGDLQDVEEVGHRHAGLEVHEVQDAVVCPPEPLPFQQRVRVAHEVAVGEVEQAHDVEGQVVGAGRRIYVSLVDIYSAGCHHCLIRLPSAPYPKATRICQGRQDWADSATASSGEEDGPAHGPARWLDLVRR